MADKSKSPVKKCSICFQLLDLSQFPKRGQYKDTCKPCADKRKARLSKAEQDLAAVKQLQKQEPRFDKVLQSQEFEALLLDWYSILQDEQFNEVEYVISNSPKGPALWKFYNNHMKSYAIDAARRHSPAKETLYKNMMHYYNKKKWDNEEEKQLFFRLTKTEKAIGVMTRQQTKMAKRLIEDFFAWFAKEERSQNRYYEILAQAVRQDPEEYRKAEIADEFRLLQEPYYNSVFKENIAKRNGGNGEGE